MANGNKALVTVMTTRLDHMQKEQGSSQRSYGVFGINEETQEVLHYTEENGAASQMVKSTPQGGHVSPPVNCGVYLFSTRVYEEFGLPTRSGAGEDDQSTGGGEISNANNNSVGNMTPSAASASGSEFAKYFSQHQTHQLAQPHSNF